MFSFVIVNEIASGSTVMWAEINALLGVALFKKVATQTCRLSSPPPSVAAACGAAAAAKNGVESTSVYNMATSLFHFFYSTAILTAARAEWKSLIQNIH